jgi:hypothetical protein
MMVSSLASPQALSSETLGWLPVTIRRYIPQDRALQVFLNLGRTIAQAVSRWLPTAAARVWQVGFVVDKRALGQVFSEYFGFPCHSSFHQILHHHNHLGQVQ